MTKAPTLSTIDNISISVPTINQNFTLIKEKFENTISRDGSIPNSMSADIDMNNKDIINVDRVYAGEVLVGGVSITSQTSDNIAAADSAAAAALSAAAAATAADSVIAPSGVVKTDLNSVSWLEPVREEGGLLFTSPKGVIEVHGGSGQSRWQGENEGISLTNLETPLFLQIKGATKNSGGSAVNMRGAENDLLDENTSTGLEIATNERASGSGTYSPSTLGFSMVASYQMYRRMFLTGARPTVGVYMSQGIPGASIEDLDDDILTGDGNIKAMTNLRSYLAMAVTEANRLGLVPQAGLYGWSQARANHQENEGDYYPKLVQLFTEVDTIYSEAGITGTPHYVMLQPAADNNTVSDAGEKWNALLAYNNDNVLNVATLAGAMYQWPVNASDGLHHAQQYMTRAGEIAAYAAAWEDVNGDWKLGQPDVTLGSNYVDLVYNNLATGVSLVLDSTVYEGLDSDGTNAAQGIEWYGFTLTGSSAVNITGVTVETTTNTNDTIRVQLDGSPTGRQVWYGYYLSDTSGITTNSLKYSSHRGALRLNITVPSLHYSGENHKIFYPVGKTSTL